MPAVKHETQKLDQDTICQTCTPTKRILFQNVNIFDGTSDVLLEGMSLLVEGNLIAKIAPTIEIDAAGDVTVIIDGGGRTLMPGLIAMHEHIMMQMTVGEILTSDSRFFAYVATVTAKVYLQNGFTSIRDAAGNTFALKAAI